MKRGAVDVDAWERRLAEEDLAPIDSADPSLAHVVSEGVDRGHLVAVAGEDAQAQFLGWARKVLESGVISSPHQRRVWELYAEGKTITEIQQAMRGDRRRVSRTAVGRRRLSVAVSRRSIFRALDRVRNMAPVPPPVANPWRKSGRDRLALRGRPLKELVAKVVTRLERTAADRRELIKLLEVHMGATKEFIKYKRIRLDGSMDIPNVVASKSELQNIDGRPHAGGIDVVLTERTSAGKDQEIRRTIPWHKIKYADVATVTE